MPKEHLGHIKSGTAHKAMTDKIMRSRIDQYREVLENHAAKRGGKFAEAARRLLNAHPA